MVRPERVEVEPVGLAGPPEPAAPGTNLLDGQGRRPHVPWRPHRGEHRLRSVPARGRGPQPPGRAAAVARPSAQRWSHAVSPAAMPAARGRETQAQDSPSSLRADVEGYLLRTLPVDDRVVERHLDDQPVEQRGPHDREGLDVDLLDLAGVDAVLHDPLIRSRHCWSSSARSFFTSGCRNACAHRSNHSPQSPGSSSCLSGRQVHATRFSSRVFSSRRPREHLARRPRRTPAPTSAAPR